MVGRFIFFLQWFDIKGVTTKSKKSLKDTRAKNIHVLMANKIVCKYAKWQTHNLKNRLNCRLSYDFQFPINYPWKSTSEFCFLGENITSGLPSRPYNICKISVQTSQKFLSLSLILTIHTVIHTVIALPEKGFSAAMYNR